MRERSMRRQATPSGDGTTHSMRARGLGRRGLAWAAAALPLAACGAGDGGGGDGEGAPVLSMAAARQALSAPHRQPEPSALEVDFRGCTEMAGIGFVPRDGAARLVPSDLTLAGDEESAIVVVRVADCEQVRVDGEEVRAGTVAQVGLSLTDAAGSPGPDPTADINNYTLWYAASSPALARQLRRAGVPAALDRSLRYEFDAGEPGETGPLSIRVRRPRAARFVARGTATAPTSEPRPFVATWWRDARLGRVSMRTELPDLRFGQSEMVVRTPPGSALAGLVGDVRLTFSVLDSFNQFDSAQMLVQRP